MSKTDRFRNRAVLRVEQLEDRTVPSTFLVKNLNPGGPDSFKVAFNSANADNGTDQIIQFQLPQGMSGTIPLMQWTGTIQKNLTVNGPGASIVSLTPDPQVGGRIFNVTTGKTVVISGLTLTGGTVAGPLGFGGAITNGGDLTLNNVTLYNNQASQDGGAIANYGTLALNAAYIWGNHAGRDGGGIANKGTTSLEQGSIVFSNSAQRNGGGISNDSGDSAHPASLIIQDEAWIYYNLAVINGGGIYNTGSTSMNGGLLDENSAQQKGGGLYNASGTASLSGVTIESNSASKGGGAYAAGGTISLGTCTVKNNNAQLGSAWSWLLNVGSVQNTDCTIINNDAAPDN